MPGYTVTTLYFYGIVISLFFHVEISSLRFNLAFSQCSASVYQSIYGQTEFLPVYYKCEVLSYLRMLDACEKYVYSMCKKRMSVYTGWPPKKLAVNYYCNNFSTANQIL